MLLVTFILFVITVIGVLVYLLSGPDKPKQAEIGRIVFAFGVLVLLLSMKDIIGIVR